MSDRIQTAHSPTLGREGGACSRGWGGGGRGKGEISVRHCFTRKEYLFNEGGRLEWEGGSYNARYVKGYTRILHLFKF